MRRNLDPLFFPRSVAVIGASDRPTSLAGAVLRNLVAGGFSGRLVAVHPREFELSGAAWVPHLEALSFAPDLAVWGVPPEVIDRELPRLLDRGTRAHVVLSAGYREAGPEGAARERALAARVRAGDGVLLGPNCMGLHVARPEGRLDASFSRARPEPGTTVLLAQSGSVAEWLLLRMAERGLGAALAASVGNMADLDLVDLLEAIPRYFPEAARVLLYLETMPEAHRLRGAMAALPPDLRVLVLRGGITAVGVRAVLGHTGALAQEPDLSGTLLAGVHIDTVTSLTHALDSLEVIERLGSPRGRRVCVLTNAGGPGVLLADALDGAGFSLPELSPELQDILKASLPSAASFANPVDLLATATPAQFRTCLSQLASAEDFDLIVPAFMHPVTVDAQVMAKALGDGLSSHRDRAVLCWLAGPEGHDALRTLRAQGVAVLPEPDRLARAVALWASRRDPDEPPWPRDRETASPSGGLSEAAASAQGPWGDPAALEAALEGPFHRSPPSARVRTSDEVPEAAARLGYPLVLKIESEFQPHKSAAGLLAFVSREAELPSAMAALAGAAPRDARWLVQRRVPAGIEVFVGFLRHPRLGPFVGFASGGAGVDARGRARWIAIPSSRPHARECLMSSPLADVLGKTVRDTTAEFLEPPALRGLESLLERLAQAALAAGALTMAEVNPALWDAEAECFWLVDCRWTAAPAPR